MRILAVLLIVTGILGAFIQGAHVFNKSYMLTLGALGSPGAQTRMWFWFCLTIVIAAIGLTLLVRGLNNRNKSNK